jgi:hypothetical protein
VYGVKLILGAIFLTAQGIKRHPWVVCACLVALITAGGANARAHDSSMTRAQLTEYVQNLVGGQRQDMERLARLERACVPQYTGGGVTQCAQPSIPEMRLMQAIQGCLTNPAYVGVTQEDTLNLLAQCLNDWNDAHPRR